MCVEFRKKVLNFKCSVLSEGSDSTIGFEPAGAEPGPAINNANANDVNLKCRPASVPA
jgi:hypothetical protein